MGWKVQAVVQWAHLGGGWGTSMSFTSHTPCRDHDDTTPYLVPVCHWKTGCSRTFRRQLCSYSHPVLDEMREAGVDVPQFTTLARMRRFIREKRHL